MLKHEENRTLAIFFIKPLRLIMVKKSDPKTLKQEKENTFAMSEMIIIGDENRKFTQSSLTDVIGRNFFQTLFFTKKRTFSHFLQLHK